MQWSVFSSVVIDLLQERHFPRVCAPAESQLSEGVSPNPGLAGTYVNWKTSTCKMMVGERLAGASRLFDHVYC